MSEKPLNDGPTEPAEPEVTKNEVNGTTYRNLHIRPFKSKNIPGIETGTHVDVKKLHKTGMKANFETKYGPMYNATVEYKGEKHTMLLSEREHELYSETGEEGDTVRISYRYYKNDNIDNNNAYAARRFEVIDE
jgi:hypothetical protein